MPRVVDRDHQNINGLVSHVPFFLATSIIHPNPIVVVVTSYSLYIYAYNLSLMGKFKIHIPQAL